MKESTPLTIKVLIEILGLLESNQKLAFRPAYFFQRSFSGFVDNKKRYYQALYNNLRYKYLRKKLIKNIVYFEITRKGRYKALRYFVKKKKLAKWDGKWRLVIFDIPEEKSYLRQRFRENLGLLGFKYLQKSVWVTPYNVRRELGIVVDYLDVGSYVNFMIVEVLEGDNWLKKQFQIK